MAFWVNHAVNHGRHRRTSMTLKATLQISLLIWSHWQCTNFNPLSMPWVWGHICTGSWEDMLVMQGSSSWVYYPKVTFFIPMVMSLRGYCHTSPSQARSQLGKWNTCCMSKIWGWRSTAGQNRIRGVIQQHWSPCVIKWMKIHERVYGRSGWFI